jgi:hypothetical protein
VNLGEAITALQDRGFDYLTSARATLMLNTAKNQFEDVAPFPWNEATTTGTAPLTINDVKSVLYVTDMTNDVQLDGFDVRAIVDGDASLDSTGTPQAWYLDGEMTLQVWPANTSASLSVRYVKFSPELEDSDDEPLIPARYHGVWIDLAVVEAYKDSDNLQAAGALLADAQRRLGEIVAVYALRGHGEHQRITYASEDW